MCEVVAVGPSMLNQTKTDREWQTGRLRLTPPGLRKQRGGKNLSSRTLLWYESNWRLVFVLLLLVFFILASEIRRQNYGTVSRQAMEDAAPIYENSRSRNNRYAQARTDKQAAAQTKHHDKLPLPLNPTVMSTVSDCSFLMYNQSHISSLSKFKQ